MKKKLYFSLIVLIVTIQFNTYTLMCCNSCDLPQGGALTRKKGDCYSPVAKSQQPPMGK